MRAAFLLVFTCCAALMACGKPGEKPEAAFRHCLLQLAREAGELTYGQAVQFARICGALADEAALAQTREELGTKFELKAAETANRIRENRDMIVDTHVCAIASDPDPKRCPPTA